MEAFYVSRQGTQEGPHPLTLILEKINTGYLRGEDFIFLSSKKEWILLSDFSETREPCQEAQRQRENTELSTVSAEEAPWFLLRKEEQLGPFTFGEILKQLRGGRVFEYEFVWTQSMATWQRIAECPAFQSENLENVNEEAPVKLGDKQKKFRRRDSRMGYWSTLVVHNHKKLWNAESLDLSVGGASVLLPKGSVDLGQVVVLHYRPTPEVPAFNIHCEVMSCSDFVGANEEKKDRVGLQFLSITKTLEAELKEIIQRRVA